MTAPQPDSKRILVVDDELTLRLSFAYALQTENNQVSSASNGREAMKLLREKKFDLLILDLRMPEMDGLETLSAIRKEATFHNLPIILCSAYIGTAAAIRALNLFCFHFLAKPVKPSDLREEVATLVDPQQQTPIEEIAADLRNDRPTEGLEKVQKLDALPNRNTALWKTVFENLARGRKLNREDLTKRYPNFVQSLLLK